MTKDDLVLYYCIVCLNVRCLAQPRSLSPYDLVDYGEGPKMIASTVGPRMTDVKGEA
jgi:hypothetical protein